MVLQWSQKYLDRLGEETTDEKALGDGREAEADKPDENDEYVAVRQNSTELQREMFKQ